MLIFFSALAKIDPLSREQKNQEQYLNVPYERRRTKEENVYLPIPPVIVSPCSSERSLPSDLKAAVPEKVRLTHTYLCERHTFLGSQLSSLVCPLKIVYLRDL